MKDEVFRCRECGFDVVRWRQLKQHYASEHRKVRLVDAKQHHVVVKPYVVVPRCQACE